MNPGANNLMAFAVPSRRWPWENMVLLPCHVAGFASFRLSGQTLRFLGHVIARKKEMESIYRILCTNVL